MLGENIKMLRQQKGFSQEILAQQLNVVRQTVSKWEKGLSVPDAETLSALADLFEVPVSTLLGSTIGQQEKDSDSETEEVAKQLAVLNEQLALQACRRRRIWKSLLIGISVAIILTISVWLTCFGLFRVQERRNAVLTTTGIVKDRERADGHPLTLVSNQITIKMVSQNKRGEFSKKDIIIFNIAQVVTHLLAWVVVAPVLDILMYAEPANKVFLQGLVSAGFNILATAIVGTLLCFTYAKTIPKKGSLKAE